MTITGDPAREKGLTLIELLAVILIIAILAAIVLSFYSEYRSRAWNTHPLSDLRTAISSALGLPEGAVLSDCVNEECKTKYPGTVLSDCTQLALYATSEADLTGLACCKNGEKSLGTKYYVYSSLAGKVIGLPFPTGTQCQLSISRGTTGSGSTGGSSPGACPSGTYRDPVTDTCQFTPTSSSSGGATSGTTSSPTTSTGTGTSGTGTSSSSGTTSGSTSSSGTSSTSSSSSSTSGRPGCGCYYVGSPRQPGTCTSMWDLSCPEGNNWVCSCSPKRPPDEIQP